MLDEKIGGRDIACPPCRTWRLIDMLRDCVVLYCSQCSLAFHTYGTRIVEVLTASCIPHTNGRHSRAAAGSPCKINTQHPKCCRRLCHVMKVQGGVVLQGHSCRLYTTPNNCRTVRTNRWGLWPSIGRAQNTSRLELQTHNGWATLTSNQGPSPVPRTR